eukprot:COSAG02_NODE_5193_length_4551_cov_21.421833_3_plen_97_part_00
MHEAPQNRIGLWYKPWFYKHVETKLERLTLPTAARSTTESIPVRSDASACSTLLCLKHRRLARQATGTCSLNSCVDQHKLPLHLFVCTDLGLLDAT